MQQSYGSFRCSFTVTDRTFSPTMRAMVSRRDLLLSAGAALGIRNASLNQPVEVAALRPQFASFLGVGERRSSVN